MAQPDSTAEPQRDPENQISLSIAEKIGLKFKKALHYSTELKAIRFIQYVMMILVVGYIAVPLLWMVMSGFKTQAELFRVPPPIIPRSLTFSNFVDLFVFTEFERYLLNSVVVSVSVVVLTLVLAASAGYGLTRSSFSGQKSLARVVLFTYMFPQILIGIPLYLLFFRVGLLNTYTGLTLAILTVTLPFTSWLMWQYFQTIPIAFEEAAWIYGASRIYTLRKVVIPMAIPGLIAISIFAFAISWSNFTLAVIIMTEDAMKTFPVAIPEFIEQQQVHWGYLNAAGVLILIPAFLFVFFLQKYIITGFRIGR